MSRRHLQYGALFVVTALIGVGIGYSIGAPAPLESPLNANGCEPHESVQASVAATSLPGDDTGTYTVNVTYDIAGDASDVRVDVPGEPRYAVNGTYEDGVFHVADGARSATVSFTASAGEDQSRGIPQYEAGQWLLTNPPTIHTAWVHDGTRHCEDAFTSRENEVVEENGLTTVGVEEMLYVTNEGATTRQTTLASNKSFTLVVPERAADDMPADKQEAITEDVQSMSHRFDVDCHRDVTMFALPEPQAGASGFALNVGGETASWVTDTQRARSPRSTWLHEYVHARQCIEYSSDMEWFNEASANYYRTTFAYELYGEQYDDWSYSSVKAEVSENTTLSKPNTWDGTGAPYYKGARTLIWLDAELHAHSNQDLEDVMRWMNNHEGTLTYAEFRTHIRMLTNEQTARQLDAYVTDSDQVPLRSDSVQLLEEARRNATAAR